jgi:hypothetical protein
MIVEVRPIPQDKWHGKKNKESFSRPIGIEVLYDLDLRRYATGLTEEETAKYSKLLGKDLTDNFNPEEPHPYWSSKQAIISLQNVTNLFNTDNPIDWVKVKNMKASKLVANSQEEYDAGKWPSAKFVIYDEAQEVSIKAVKLDLKDKCVSFLQKMTLEDKQNVTMILSNKSMRGKSENFVRVEIEELITKDPGEFLRIASMGKDQVAIRALVLEGLYKRDLTKENLAIKFMGETIGISVDDAVSNLLNNPDYNRVKVALLERASSKR